jgi:hypothetical protein
MIGIAVVFMASVTFGQTYAWKSEDDSSPLLVRVKNGDAVTVTASATALLVTNTTDGLASKSIVLTETKTVAEAVAEINALTNSAGTFIYEAAVWSAVSTDTISNRLLAVSAVSIAGGTFSRAVKWDTSAYLSYTVIADSAVSGTPVGAYGINKILGNPGGTGNVTVNVYEDDTLIYQRVVPSPVYLLPALTTANPCTNVVDAVVSLNLDVGNIRIGSGKRGLVKVTRATTATTGGIGVATTR